MAIDYSQDLLVLIAINTKRHKLLWWEQIGLSPFFFAYLISLAQNDDVWYVPTHNTDTQRIIIHVRLAILVVNNMW